MTAHDIARTRQRLTRLAWLLDSSIRLPGLNFRIGLDALIGLIPGIGDVIGVVASGYIVREAARAGLPRSVLARMVFNVAIEGVVGVIPLLGDLFDAGWKANQRNVRLLDAWLSNPHRARNSSRAFVFGIVSVLVALLLTTAVLGFLLLRWLWQTVAV